MNPMNVRPIRFPSKTDAHPGKGLLNWWEATNSNRNKKSERFDVKMMIRKELSLIENIGGIK